MATPLLLAMLGLAAACTATPPAPADGAGEDLAAARLACATVPEGAERERCLEVQLRRARGARNTY